MQIVESFWSDVWVARNPDAVDRYVVDDFVITSAGEEIRSRAAFKQWIREFQTTIARADDGHQPLRAGWRAGGLRHSLRRQGLAVLTFIHCGQHLND